MRPLLTAALFAPFLGMLAGCAVGGPYDAPCVGRFVPVSDRALERMLGNYPSPGASPSNEIRDTLGNIVPAPKGLDTFADTVVAYEVGSPAPIAEGQDPEAPPGPPGYTPHPWARPPPVSLGNGGSITLRFSKRAIVDVDGPDLFIFEIGP